MPAASRRSAATARGYVVRKLLATLLWQAAVVSPLVLNRDGEVVMPVRGSFERTDASAGGAAGVQNNNNAAERSTPRNSYELFGSHRSPNARICDASTDEQCGDDPLAGSVSREALDRLRSLDKADWPQQRPLEVVALGLVSEWL